MAKTITLSDLVVTGINIDYENQRAFVNYTLVDSDSKSWISDVAIFWVTMPPHPKDMFGNELPYPDNWFVLPPSYIPTLVSLKNDADQALTNKFLV